MRELWANNNSGSSDIGRQHGWIRPLLPRPGRWRHRFSVGRTDRGTTARTSDSGQYNMDDDGPVVVDVPTTAGSLCGISFPPVLEDATGGDDVMSDVGGLEDDDCGDGADHGDKQEQELGGGTTQLMLFGEYQTSEGTFDSAWGMTIWCILDGPQHDDENRFAENGMDEDGCHHHNSGRQQRAWTWSETLPRTDVP